VHGPARIRIRIKRHGSGTLLDPGLRNGLFRVPQWRQSCPQWWPDTRTSSAGPLSAQTLPDFLENHQFLALTKFREMFFRSYSSCVLQDDIYELWPQYTKKIRKETINHRKEA
jgi:hypothetical protein